MALTSYNSFYLLGDPQTLFSLENMRAARIPYIIIFLQKMFRGTIARREYKRLKAAQTIANAYRRYKLCSYVDTLYSTLREINHLADFGRSLTWPAHFSSLSEFVDRIYHMYDLWRANKILSSMPQFETCASSENRRIRDV